AAGVHREEHALVVVAGELVGPGVDDPVVVQVPGGGDHPVTVAVRAAQVGDLAHRPDAPEGPVGHPHVAVAIHRGAAGAVALVGGGTQASLMVVVARAGVAGHLAPGAGVDLGDGALAAVGDPGEGQVGDLALEHQVTVGILGHADGRA